MSSIHPGLVESTDSSNISIDVRKMNEEIDHFDRLPDSILIIIFNKIADVKALGRCCVVSRRFHCIVPQVDNVVVKVDCVISDEDVDEIARSADKGRNPFSQFVKLIIGGIAKPLYALGHLLGPKKSCVIGSGGSDGEISHHSPTEVLKNFNEIKWLRVELPGGELGVDDGVLLKWKADFGSTLDSCVILGASSITSRPSKSNNSNEIDEDEYSDGSLDDHGNIPDSFYTNGGLKLRVIWTISSLIAASARHYLLQQIIEDHPTLESLILTDSDEQGTLFMDKQELKELREKPLAASTSSNRTVVPALSMRLWYAASLELSDGRLMKGATLVAIRPTNQNPTRREISDAVWVSTVFEEPFASAAELLVKRKTYCLEMNSF